MFVYSVRASSLQCGEMVLLYAPRNRYNGYTTTETRIFTSERVLYIDVEWQHLKHKPCKQENVYGDTRLTAHEYKGGIVKAMPSPSESATSSKKRNTRDQEDELQTIMLRLRPVTRSALLGRAAAASAASSYSPDGAPCAS